MTGPDLQATEKAIPHNATTVTIRQRDLLTPSQKSRFAGYPNLEQNLATVSIPWSHRYHASDRYPELIILSTNRG